LAVEVWSITSWSELRHDARAADAAGESSWITQCVGTTTCPTVLASDYVSALPDLIRPWLSGPTRSLGTDGFGRSDTRAALRDYFAVDAAAVIRTALGLINKP
jgi:pyruvate dehydrogenase E1 component